MLRKVISGGQIGVERAALDAAVAYELQIGGWCPMGRVADDGPIESFYPLDETTSFDNSAHIRANVEASDATLVVIVGVPSPPSREAVAEAMRQRRPCFVANLRRPQPERVSEWIAANGVEVLHVTGRKAHARADLPKVAETFLGRVLAAWQPVSG